MTGGWKWAGSVGLAAALFGDLASAATLNIAVNGTCLEDCANLGLTDGNGIGGSILVDDAYFVANGYSGNVALISYDFAFGNFSFSSTDPPDPGFGIRWGATPGSVSAFLISASVSSDPVLPGPLLHLDTLLGGASLASLAGYRKYTECCLEIGYSDPAYLSVDGIEVTPIPLPVPVFLLAGGVAVLGAFGLRRLAVVPSR